MMDCVGCLRGLAKFWYLTVMCVVLGACGNNADDAALPTLAALPSPVDVALGLQFWQAQDGRLENASERDSYEFGAQANDNIRLGAVEQGQAVLITLYSPDGTILASGDSIETQLPSKGLYRVQVQTIGEGASNYSLGLAYTDRPNPNQPTPIDIVVGIPTPTPDFGDLGTFILALDAPQQQTTALTADAPRHVYTLQGREGAFVTLTANRVSGTLDPYLTLYNAEGDIVAMDDNAGGNLTARLLNVRLQAQTYELQVTGKDGFGEYQLRYQTDFQTPTADTLPSPTPIPVTPYVTPTLGVQPSNTRLVDHAPILGRIESPNDFRQYSFYGDENTFVTIGVAPFGNSGLRPMVEIYDPDGALIVQGKSTLSNDSGSAYVTGIPLSISGAYLVIVTGESDTVGDFTLSYGRGVSRLDNYKGRAEPNVRLNSVLAPKGLRDVWAVTLQAGDVITVAVSSPSAALDPTVELTDSDGNVLVRDDNSAGGNDALIRSAQINTSGQYFLRVETARGDQIGDYVLVWRYINLAPSPTPIPEQITLMRLRGTVLETQYVFYRFYGTRGQNVNIAVLPTAGSALDGIAVLLDTNGNPIAQGLPADGTYTIRVNGYLSGGSFDLEVVWLK
jgi:hypothetical protein